MQWLWRRPDPIVTVRLHQLRLRLVGLCSVRVLGKRFHIRMWVRRAVMQRRELLLVRRLGPVRRGQTVAMIRRSSAESRLTN